MFEDDRQKSMSNLHLNGLNQNGCELLKMAKKNKKQQHTIERFCLVILVILMKIL